jgi:hypothetical protein
MARGFSPLVHMHRANIKAYTATTTNIPVNPYSSSPYAELLRWVHGAPDGNAFLFASFFPFLPKIRIDSQMNNPLSEIITSMGFVACLILTSVTVAVKTSQPEFSGSLLSLCQNRLPLQSCDYIPHRHIFYY